MRRLDIHEQIDMCVKGANDTFINLIMQAAEDYDGHVTLMKFTTGWKIVFGTPVINGDDREVLEQMPTLPLSIAIAFTVATGFNVAGHKMMKIEKEHDDGSL